MNGMRYKISMDLASLANMSVGIKADVLPLVNQAVKGIAQATAAQWVTSVQKAKLWSGEKDAYAGSITYRMTGDFSAVVESDYKHAAEIETGRPARDLKKMLDTSMKVRRTEDGRRFLVIPFRHNTPGNNAHAKAMPSSVHQMAEKMGASRVTGIGKRRSGDVTVLSPKTGMHASSNQTPFLSNPKTKKHQTVTKLTTAWGDRISAQMLRDAGADQATVKRYAGMVKTETSTPGGGKSSAYLTFRVMMEGSKGWIVPAQPGKFIAKKVAEDMQPKAQSAIELAIKKTMGG